MQPPDLSSSSLLDMLLNHHQTAHTQAQMSQYNPGPSTPVDLDPFLQHFLASDGTPASISSPVYGPENPYDPYTELGRAFIERRDSEDFPGLVDRWIQATMCAWHRDDPRCLSTDMLPDRIKCTVEIVHFPVCFIVFGIKSFVF